MSGTGFTRSARARCRRLIGGRLCAARVGIAVCGGLAASLAVWGGAPSAARAQPAPQPMDCVTASPPCYSPLQFRFAYDVQPLLDRGIDGRGETVTVIDFDAGPTLSPPQVTDVRQDLASFDERFDLPPARLHVVTSLAGGVTPWNAGTEEVMDTEIVHAIAPQAHLRVVLIPSAQTAADATAGQIAGLRVATQDTDVVSLSGSMGEHFFTQGQLTQLRQVLRAAAARHVTVVAASGDSGVLSDVYRFGVAPVKEVSLPASDPLVLGVGGTSLTAAPETGSYLAERAWNQSAGGRTLASGGGFSGIFAQPAYQRGVPGTGPTRAVPDVSGDADVQMGMALAVTAADGGYDLRSAGGTSASTPLWGGLIALADQFAGRDLGPVNPTLYQIARSPLYGRAFHDITTGNNTAVSSGVTYPGYQAATGWDAVTGLGSPNAAVLIPLLRRPITSR